MLASSQRGSTTFKTGRHGLSTPIAEAVGSARRVHLRKPPP
jgi:hypothetical protein